MITRLKVVPILKQSWRLLKGSKGPILFAILPLCFVLCSSIFIALEVFHRQDFLSYFISVMIAVIISAPFTTGAVLIGAKRARNEVVFYKSGYQYVNYWNELSLATCSIYFICMGLMLFPSVMSTLPSVTTNTGCFVVLFVMTIVLIIGFLRFFLFFLPLIADKKMNMLDAISKSTVLIGKEYGKIFILYLLIGFASFLLFLAVVDISILFEYPVLVSIFLFSFLSIWVVPYWFIVTGVIYHQLIDGEVSYEY